jgi:nitroimidazol reductase NimA-like FMN-containing flavoprotein (pyridoxamine 5'-phosphate oxidase superfamily)
MGAMIEELTNDESMRLIEQAEIGRIGFTGRFGPVVLPVNYKVVDGTVVFRTEEYGSISQDLRTGIPEAAYRVAFEVDEMDPATKTGWSVLVQGAARHVDDESERASLLAVGVEPWAAGERALFMRITPSHVTGRRIRRA